MNKDGRISEIKTWLQHDLNLKIIKFEPASTDASFRRYFRVTDPNGTYIVMDAPPDKENTEPFIKVAELFSAANVHVPAIWQQNRLKGFLLLEDFGNIAYLEKLNDGNCNGLYQDAFASLHHIQAIDIKNLDLPHYDHAFLKRELAIFEEWFLQAWQNVEMTKEIQTLLQETWSILIDSALAQPKVCVHRDYHSRNLMYIANGNPGIIDFQDAVIGPVTYDLVSLLKDCYIKWPETQIQTWALSFYTELRNSARIDCDPDTFFYWFDLMGMQRHLKAIGIFARLKLRDNKPDYIKDIPRTLDYVKTVSHRYENLKPFYDFLCANQFMQPGTQP